MPKIPGWSKRYKERKAVSWEHDKTGERIEVWFDDQDLNSWVVVVHPRFGERLSPGLFDSRAAAVSQAVALMRAHPNGYLQPNLVPAREVFGEYR